MPDQQDLGITQPRPPDRLWQRTKPMAMVPSQERLDKPSQTCRVKNTSPNQKHVVIDRHMVGHELEPGQEKEMELLVADIEHFRSRRSKFSGRVDQFGTAYPPHPIVIDGVYDVDQPAQPAVEKAQPSPKQQAAKAAG